MSQSRLPSPQGTCPEHSILLDPQLVPVGPTKALIIIIIQIFVISLQIYVIIYAHIIILFHYFLFKCKITQVSIFMTRRIEKNL
jgi:hypothetical protein